MALKILTQFPIFFPPSHHHHHHRRATEIRFSRWNNAETQKFNRQERTQKQQIEDDTVSTPTGAPSPPSSPSLTGKASNYSKTHPAFRRTFRLQKLPNRLQELPKDKAGIKISDNGISYVIPDAPFEFQYSYTEAPKVKPLKLREAPITPFGPGTMPRPWTGRKPLPPSKKKIDFDSFKLPPPHKKGVKPVQHPGPFLPGSGPKYVQSREEILGEPLTKEEIDDLVKGSLKSKRKLNMGRDGLTHNMLDNIHALWKRRRVCKIQCKGVCTVDMENVRQQLEDKTGGKIIYSRGGVLYLFRGRNYNYKTRPQFPLMLWKPVPPVYPKLIKKTPEGLTQEEANEMRIKGRKLIPICKLGKNGVYSDLVKHVQEAFEACELVRINCQGMNPSDYKKIGAKLMELVPCVLISFEYEHILTWRGNDWKSSLPMDDDPIEVKEPKINGESSISLPSEGEEQSIAPLVSATPDHLNSSTSPLGSDKAEDRPYIVNESNSPDDYVDLDGTKTMSVKFSVNQPEEFQSAGPQILNELQDVSQNSTIEKVDLNSSPNSTNITEKVDLNSLPWTQGVLTLLDRAVEGGSAVVLDEYCLDPDIVYQRAVSLAKSAPPGPVFRVRRPRKKAVENVEKLEGGELEGKEVFNQVGGDLEGKEVFNQEGGELEVKVVKVLERRGSQRKSSGKQRKKDYKGEIVNVVPHGSLRVDELAKLLA
ncbi:hypothetical protein LguiA_005015 [Lonicera macranthoides]